MDTIQNKAVDIKDFSMSFTDEAEELKVLNKISFDVKKGEFVTIIGPSGCGKSTLFKAMGDILNNPHTKVEGRMKILNFDPERARENRKIGIVFQKPTLLEWRNIKKNIELPLEIMNVTKEYKQKRSQELLKLVGLEDYSNYRPSKLSGGMQQRVSIARALAYNPEVLLMDEPFGALDEITRRKMNDELIKVWQETKKSILFVTHSIEEAVYLSERIVILSKSPGEVSDIIEIDFGYPRSEVFQSDKFFKYIKQVRGKLEI